MQLTTLQSRLAAFRHRRQRMRWGMAWSAQLVALLAILGAFFAIDVGFSLSVPQRVALLILGAAALIWATKRFVWPWLGVRESETDVALLVERQHGIDSDLVAALQFDRVGSGKWGSPALQDAVVSRMAAAASQLDVFRGTDYGPVLRRLRLLGASLLIAVVIAVLFPRHLAVFFPRLLLSNRHYPSDTTIETIAVNNVPVFEWNAVSVRPRDTWSAKNRPVAFLVQCRGKLPEAGRIDCRSVQHGTSRPLELRRLTAEEVTARLPKLAGQKGGEAAYYFAELPQLVEGLDFVLRLGDAWTDPARIQTIEPPLVELSVEVTPPAYAAAMRTSTASPRHLAVLEGSRVSLQLRCLNQKPLTQATIKITRGEVVGSHNLVQDSPATGLTWTLPAETSLAHVTEELRYEIQVADRDGLGLESPLIGWIQLKPDRPPVGMASVVHRVVLPNARPVVEFRLMDDFGIASAELFGELEREPSRENAISDAAEEKPPTDSVKLTIPLDPTPLIGQNLPKRGVFPLDLSPYRLAKGDRLKLTLAVTDFRGDRPGTQHLSEPILLEVSDEAGVLADITEADERSEKRLGDVIKQQLGVGGNP